MGDSMIPSILERVYKESVDMGIPAMSQEDGMILMSLSFLTASSGGSIFIDAGAGIGYSTLWISEGIIRGCRDTCEVIAIEVVGDRCERLKVYLGSISSKTLRSRVICSDAIEVLRIFPRESIDFAFIDIEKSMYPEALRIVESRIRRTGIVVIHNAISPRPPSEFFDLASRDPWRSIIVPTPAGLMILVNSTRS